MYVCTHDLPIAEIGDCSVGVTTTVIEDVGVPPESIMPTATYPADSIIVYFSSVNSKCITVSIYRY